MQSNIEDIIESFEKMSLTNASLFTAAKAVADFLPTYDGEGDQLESFISRCDKFFNCYGTTTDNNLSDFCFNVICSKLRGDVSNFLMCRPDLTTWPLTKAALREHYGDKIDRQTLTREFLHLTKYKRESILDFLERLKRMKSRVDVKIQTDSTLTADQKDLLMTQNDLNALDVLTANSDERLRLLLDIKQPQNLIAASDVVIRHSHNEMRVNSLIRTTQGNFRKPFIPKNSYNHRPQQFQQNHNYESARSNNYVPRYNHNNQNYSHSQYNQTPSQVANQNFQQSIPHYNNFNRNVFTRHNPRTNTDVFAPRNAPKPIESPEPMDTSTIRTNTSRKPRNINSPYEEIYNTEMEKQQFPDKTFEEHIQSQPSGSGYQSYQNFYERENQTSKR